MPDQSSAPSNVPSLIQKKSFTRSAGIVSIGVMGSRVLGLVREKVIAYYFASGIGGDAIYAAFRIPNLLRDLFAEGAMSKAFITTFTDTEMKDGPDAAWQLANRTLNVLGLVLAIITCIGILIAPQIVDVMLAGKGFDTVLDANAHFGFSDKRMLTVYLTRIMFPFLMLVSFAAIAMGVLNSKGIFGIPAWASSFFNVTALVVGVAGYYLLPEFGLHPTTGMAIGFLAGGAAQLLVQIPSMYKVGFRYRPLISFRDHRVRQVLRLMGPAILGAAALQVNIFANAYFASYGEGWLTWITRAFRLLHLPIGVFGVAISTVVLPNLAKQVAAGQIDNFNNSFSRAMRLVFFLAIPSTFGLIILAEPICRLIFEGGAAGDLDTVQTANALFFYAIGLCGYSAVKITTDGFYAFKNTKTPVKVSLATIALNIFLNYLFIMHLGLDHRSLALSTAITITLNFSILLFLLRRKVGRLGGREISRTILKVLAASALMALACWWALRWIESTLGTASFAVQCLGVFAPILVALAVFVGMCKAMRVRELGEILKAIRKKK
ncbi:MAG: murein biosynthesis integral membrane protein MurJ [bacterium]